MRDFGERMVKNDLSYYERRIKLHELENLCTENFTENRAEIDEKTLDIYHSLWYDYLTELRYNHNHDSKGRFCSGGSGGKMSAPQSPADFIKYVIKEDPESVAAIKQAFIAYGVAEENIDLSGIKNTEVLEPFLERLKIIKERTGFVIPNIYADHIVKGDECCIAAYSPFEKKFYISSRYFNSKAALTDTAKNWADKGIMPKQFSARSIDFLAEHEAAHMRIPDKILESKESLKIWKNRKIKSKNDTDIFEYYADVVAIKQTSKYSDSNMNNAIAYLSKSGVNV